MHIANKKDFFSALVILLLVGVCVVESRNIDPGIGFALGPLFFPHLLLGIISLFCCMLMLGSVRVGQAPAAQAAPTDRKTVLLRVGLMALTAAYLAILPIAGYAPCTVVFLMAAMLLLGKRDLKHAGIYVAVALGITFGLQYVFGSLLHLFLP